MYADFLGWSKAQFINRVGQRFGEGCLGKEEFILRTKKSNHKITACASKLHSPRVPQNPHKQRLRLERTEDRGFATRLSELLLQMFDITVSGIINIVLVENKLLWNTQGEDEDKKSNLFSHVNGTAPSSEWLEGNCRECPLNTRLETAACRWKKISEKN